MSSYVVKNLLRVILGLRRIDIAFSAAAKISWPASPLYAARQALSSTLAPSSFLRVFHRLAPALTSFPDHPEAAHRRLQLRTRIGIASQLCQQQTEILKRGFFVRSYLQLPAISRDRILGFAGLLQFQGQVDVRMFVIGIQFNLLAERSDRVRVIVGAGIGQPRSYQPSFTLEAGPASAYTARFSSSIAVPIVLALQRLHSRFVQFIRRAFHLRSCLRLCPAARRRQNRARQQLIFIAVRRIAKRFIIRAPSRREFVHLHDQFALAFQHSFAQRSKSMR